MRSGHLIILGLALTQTIACMQQEPDGPPVESAQEALTVSARTQDRGARQAEIESPARATESGKELSAAERVQVLADPLHIQARAAGAQRAAQLDEAVADRLTLAARERSEFVGILARAQEARTQIVEFHKQHRNVTREQLDQRMSEELPASVLEEASATFVHDQLRAVLGAERYGRYVELLETAGDQ